MIRTANSKGVREPVLLLTEPQRVENKDLILPIAEHDYRGGKTAWRLSEEEQMAMVLKVRGTGKNGADAVTEPIAGKVFFVINNSSQAITVKATGKKGVTVAVDKVAMVMGDGEDFIRLTADV